MTDKPEPTAEHIDPRDAESIRNDPEYRVVVVADAFRDVASPRQAERLARLLLNSTDPAVHAAQAANLPTDVMLAALVERGELEREDRPVKIKADGSIIADAYIDFCTGWAHRLVTPWKPTP